MIALKHIKSIVIPEDRFEVVKGWAKQIEFGGRSSVYADKAERKRYLEENQLTGQMGEYGACLALYDYEKYVEKQTQEIAKGEGDDGSDIIGASIPIDVKTSNVKVPDANWGRVLNSRHLMVSPYEHSPNMIYIAAVVLDTPKHSDSTGEVHVIGWAWGRNIHHQTWRERPTDDHPLGRERDGFRIKYGALKPLKDQNWKSLLLDS